MCPLFTPILSRVQLPKILIDAVEDRANTAVETGQIIKTDNEICALAKNVEIRWPVDDDEFQNRFPRQADKVKYLIQVVVGEINLARRYKRMVESTKERPYWVFTCVKDSCTPKACLEKREGVVLHFTDDFWRNGQAMCGGIECRCMIRNPLPHRIGREH